MLITVARDCQARGAAEIDVIAGQNTEHSTRDAAPAATCPRGRPQQLGHRKAASRTGWNLCVGAIEDLVGHPGPSLVRAEADGRLVHHAGGESNGGDGAALADPGLQVGRLVQGQHRPAPVAGGQDAADRGVAGLEEHPTQAPEHGAEEGVDHAGVADDRHGRGRVRVDDVGEHRQHTRRSNSPGSKRCVPHTPVSSACQSAARASRPDVMSSGGV